jgi:hypothetical protein
MNAMNLFCVAVLLLFLLCAFQWRLWKRRAEASRRDLKIWKEALHAVSFEATNSANAIRANLVDFRETNGAATMSEHLDEIETGVQRIAEIVKIVDDPVAWHGRRQSGGEPAYPPDS